MSFNHFSLADFLLSEREKKEKEAFAITTYNSTTFLF